MRSNEKGPSSATNRGNERMGFSRQLSQLAAELPCVLTRGPLALPAHHFGEQTRLPGDFPLEKRAPDPFESFAPPQIWQSQI